MKNVLVLFVAMLAVMFAQAQRMPAMKVPTVVKSALQKKYPNAKQARWEKEKGNYEAGFVTSGTNYSVLLDGSGNILETEIEIEVDQLPTNAKAHIAKHFAGQKIKEAAKITDSKGIVTYEAELKGKDLIFAENGSFIKEVKD